MAISIGNATSNTAATSTTVVVTAPSGIEVNDILIGWIGCDNEATYAGTFAWPDANWTEWARVVIAAGARWGFFGWKRAIAADLSASDYTFTGSAGAYWGATLLVVKGCKTTGDPVNVAISNTPYTTNDANIQAASLSPTGNNIALVWAGGDYSASDPAITPPSGFTEAAENGRSTWVVALATKTGVSAGATDVVNGTVAGGAVTTKHAMMVALEPSSTDTTLTAIERKDGAGGTYDEHYRGLSSAGSWADPTATLSNGVTYYYRARSVVDDVPGEYSDEVSVGYTAVSPLPGGRL